MAKQKNHDDLNIDLSDLFSEAEKAIETISTPKTSSEDISFEIEIEETADVMFSDSDEFTGEYEEEVEIDLDAELSFLEKNRPPLSETEQLREDLFKAKRIIRLQKEVIFSAENTQPDPVAAIDSAQLESLQKEIAQLKERIKDGHKAQLEKSKELDKLQASLAEEKERSSQLRTSYASMRSKAEELKQNAEQLQTRLKRVQERRKKETEENNSFGSTPAMKAIIPAIENLERALGVSHVDAESLIKGLKLSLDQLSLDLAKVGLIRIQTAKGTDFDPNIHEAIQKEFDPTVSEGSIVKELAAGFTLNGRLIRAAKVAVASGQENSPSIENSPTEIASLESDSTKSDSSD